VSTRTRPHEERGALAAQDPAPASFRTLDGPVEEPLRDVVEASLLIPRRVAQQPRAHHRRQRQRDRGEMRIVIPRVSANSRNRRPTTSPMNKQRK